MFHLKKYFDHRFDSLSQILAAFGCILLLLATGCASSGRSAMRQPLSVKLSQFKSAAIEVKSALPHDPEKLDEFKVQLESRIVAKLRQQKAFGKTFAMASSDLPAELNIVVIITKVREVDNFNRVMFGAFAGQANTTATVELREQATGKLLGSGEIEGKSSGGTVFAGTTPEAIERVADEVVRLITENL
ncbi:MAG: hypothetical protein JWQ71_2155 [Pedosphaera sp.]|nr:hypothetical protein [Pedosphaera sp.]